MWQVVFTRSGERWPDRKTFDDLAEAQMEAAWLAEHGEVISVYIIPI